MRVFKFWPCIWARWLSRSVAAESAGGKVERPGNSLTSCFNDIRASLFSMLHYSAWVSPSPDSIGVEVSPSSAVLLKSSICFSAELSTPRQCWIRNVPRS